MKLENRFLVIKIADIEKYLSEHEEDELTILVGKVERGRKYAGKYRHRYIVINLDEPYAPDVLKLMGLES